MMMCRARTAPVLLTVAIAAGALASAACSKPPAAQQAADVRDEVARQQRINALLQRRIELAAGKEFYLVLDPAAPDLTLMLRGAELQRYPVLGMQVGEPRIAWVDRRDARPWQGMVWVGGALDPPRQIDRLIVQEPAPAKEGEEPEPPRIPPTAEELYPVPTRYHLRFADGFSVEIRPREADVSTGRLARLRASWNAKWRDVFAAMRSEGRDAVRVRVVLNPKDAESLYRALPPDVRLLVLAGANTPRPQDKTAAPSPAQKR